MKHLEEYEIYKNTFTQKYGIRDTNMDRTVVKCVFDNIEFYENSGVVRFTLNGLQAVYKIDDIGLLNM